VGKMNCKQVQSKIVSTIIKILIQITGTQRTTTTTPEIHKMVQKREIFEYGINNRNFINSEGTDEITWSIEF
jgi:hypothetical protein